MPNEFIVKNGLIVGGNVVTSGTITINGALAATQSWVASQGYLTSASLSGYATQSYVTSAIAALVDSAPAALDTLNELAAALGDDANFATTITTSIGNKVSKSGDTMTGSLLFTAVANNVRLEKSGSFLNLLDTYSNIHLYNGGNGIYIDSNVHYWRSQGATYWMTLNSAGLGIGTQSPETKLHVAGGKITLKGGSSTDQQIVFNYAREYVNGIYNSSGHFRLQDNSLGGTVYQWDGSTFAFPNGNVGIGTTSPARKLNIVSSNAQIRISDGTANTYWELNSVYFQSNQDFFIQNQNGAAFTINSSGNVGIGTTNPAFKFEVGAVGSGYVSAKLTQTYEKVRYNNFDLLGYGDGHLWMIGNNNPSIVLASSWDWDNQVEFDYVPNTVGAAAGVLSIGQTNKNNANYTHGITRFFTNGSERLRIDSAGNVGIGTSSPTGKLDIVPVAQNAINISRAGGYASLYSSNDLVFETDSVFYFGVYTPRLFSVNGSFYTTVAGNVGIGTGSPGAKLHVVGNTYIQSGILFVDTIAAYTTNLISIGASTNVLVPSGDITIGSAASTSSSQPFGDFSQLKFDNLHSDTNRGPNKIVMHDNGGSWIGGFGIHSDTVSYYTGGHHRWYKTTSQTSSDQVMQLDASGNLSVTGTFSASGYNSSNWNTAYSWGNHASAGYVTSSGSVNYANSAGYAATAGALTSMNISQFTNNSGYVAYGNYSWTSPVFGQYGIKSNLIDNVLYSAADRFEVFKDGVAWNTNCVFNLNYDQNCDVIPTSTSRTYSIVLNTKGNSSSGITYTEGNVYLSFYYVYIPASVSGRVRFQNGTWVNMSGWTNVANSGSYAVWRGNVPGGNYMVEIEITINASASINTWFAQWEYVMGRPGQYELGIINKAQDNSLWRNMYFRDSSNNVQVSIGASGLSTSQNLHISGTSALYFPSYGGGFYMQDSSWIRTVNYKSIWTQTGLLGTDGGLTVGYGGATPPSGGAIISGNVGIGTTSLEAKLHVVSGASQAGILSRGVSGDTWFPYSNGQNYVRGVTNFDLGSVYFTGGNIGIGTNSPASLLHVYNNADVWHTRIGGASGELRIGGQTSSGAVIQAYTPGGSVRQLYLQRDGGNVGIGTDSPTAILQINGAGGDGSPSLRIISAASDTFNWASSTQYANLTAGETSLHLIGKANSQYNQAYFGYRHVSDGSSSNMLTLGLYAADYLLNILGNGNVGIGTTSPSAKLHVNGTFISNAFWTNSSSIAFWGAHDTAYGGLTWDTGQATVYATSGNKLYLASNGSSPDVTIDTNGNLGIGTTSPGSKLSILGNNDVLSVTSQTGDTSLPTKMLAQYVGLFNNGSNGHHLYINSSQELGSPEFNITKTWGGYLTFGVSGDGTARTRALYINNNGYVGVNVNPISGDRFEVAGSVRIHTGNNWDAIQIYSDGANGYIQGLGDETGLRIRSEYGNILLADNRGNVGIGTTTPQVKLDVNGALGIVGSNFIYFGHSTGNIGAWTTRQYSNGSTHTFNAQTFIFNNEGYGSYQHMALTANGVNLRGKNTIDSTDSWLRLNQSGDYGSGVYTPGLMRADGGFQVSGSTVWHAGNDGSGSGLDADLLDGLHASSFVRNDTTGQYLKPYYEYGSSLSASTTPSTIVSQMGGGGLRVDFLQNPSFGSWGHSITWSGYNGYNMYQLAGHYKGSGGEGPDLYVRCEPNHAQNSWSSWQKLWHSGHFTDTNISNWNTAYGWGNHASADYIVKGTQILSSASWPTATRFGSVGSISQDAGNHALSVRSELGNDAFMSFHIGSDYAVHFGLDGVSNRMSVGGWSDGAVKYQLWDTRDFTSTNVSNWNTAYSWGNHASQSYATTSYVTTQINNLIAGAPGALDTLDELAAALGDDASFATTVTNSIATKLPLAGGTMTGDINWTQTDRGLTWGMNTDGAYIKFYNTGDGDVNSRLEYATSDNGDEYHRWLIAGTEKMTLKWAGLTINGTITATGYNNTNWDTAYSSLANYLPLAGGTMSGSINMNGNNVINIGQVNATHAIFTNDGSSRVMYLRGSGNIIQFQNAAATDKWEIVGRDGEFYVYKSDGAGSGYKWRIDGVGNHTITGNLTVAGTITESSSIKLKENVKTSEGNLEKVVNLRPVTYNKIGSQTTELGLIAEEVAEVYPEFVQYDENGEPVGVHYSRLTAALIGAVKELTNQVQELNKKING